MPAPRPTFPLRFTDPTLREAVREVAVHEHISQNEYIEQAIVNDLAVRGALRAANLKQAAARLTALSDDQIKALTMRSLAAFAEGERLPDPVEMKHLASSSSVPTETRGHSRRGSGVLAAAAAFRQHA